MTCDRSNEIQAFYDGELSPERAASIESHLRECAECSELLAELKGMSQLLATVPLAQMRPGAADRFANAWYAATDRGVLRIASWLTAAAAAVLIGAVLTWPGQAPTQVASTSDTFETLATAPPAQTHEESRSDVVVLAQWIADDLSSGEQGLR